MYSNAVLININFGQLVNIKCLFFDDSKINPNTINPCVDLTQLFTKAIKLDNTRS